MWDFSEENLKKYVFCTNCCYLIYLNDYKKIYKSCLSNHEHFDEKLYNKSFLEICTNKLKDWSHLHTY